MSAIQHLVLSGQKKEAVQYFSIFGKYLRISLEEDAPQLLNLEKLKKALTNYLALENLRFQKEITIQYGVGDQPEKKLIEYPYQIILKELNRIINQHIRFQTENEILLTLSIEHQHKEIVIIIAQKTINYPIKIEEKDAVKKRTFERSEIRFSI